MDVENIYRKKENKNYFKKYYLQKNSYETIIYIF